MNKVHNESGSLILVILIAVLTLVLVGLLIWAVFLSGSGDEVSTSTTTTASSDQGTSSTTEPEGTSSTTQPTEPTTEPTTKPTEPATEPTTKPTTKPTEPTPGDEEPKDEARLLAEAKISAFAAEHGYTLADYPEKIIDLYARKPETEEYVLNYPLEYGKPHAIDISGHANDEGVPLFIQWDKQWGYLDYTGSVAGLAACGPTCMSMIMYHFTRDAKYTPAYMMKFAESNTRYAVKGSGTQWAFFKEGGKELGLDVKELNSDQMKSEKQIAQIVNSGRIIVMNVKPGIFTTVGHYMLIVGYEDGKFRVNDPNSPSNSETLWDFEQFSGDVRIMWSFGM